MAGTLSLSDGVTTVTLSPLAASLPQLNVDNGLIEHIGITGKTYAYARWQKVKHNLEFNNVSKADADVVNGWSNDKTELTYTPDTDSSGVTYTVLLLNDDNPLTWMPNLSPDTKFQGMILIREV